MGETDATVTLSKTELAALLQDAVKAGETKNAEAFHNVTATPEKEYTLPDVLRLLVNSARLADEVTVNACHKAIDLAFPADEVPVPE